MPWIHGHVSYQGRVQACCTANIPFGNINEKSLAEIWNDEPIKAVREQFLKGEMDNRCMSCIHVEEAGAKSIRQETFEKYPNIRPTSEEAELPIYYDIRFSNLCNFKCRTCWHGYSSKWFEEAKQLKNTAGDKAIIYNIEDFDQFIEQTKDGLKNAQEIYLAGGEPLITEEHYRLLEWLIEQGNTFVHLRYNTNLSHLRFKQWDILELWQSFDKVSIQYSVDAAEELGEYIRKEMDWQQSIENLQKLKTLPNVNIVAAPTISILNIQGLPPLYEALMNNQLLEKDAWKINFLERPFYYNIKAIPKAHKDRIQKEIENWIINKDLPQTVKDQMEQIIQFMQSEQMHEKHWNKFLQVNGKLDEWRKESYPLF